MRCLLFMLLRCTQHQHTTIFCSHRHCCSAATLPVNDTMLAARPTFRTRPVLLLVVVLYMGVATWFSIASLSTYRLQDSVGFFSDGFPYNGKFFVHYIRFKPDNGNTTLRFLDFVSMMSAFNNLRPDKIIVHGDAEPTGMYWQAALQSGIVEFRSRNITKQVGHRFGKIKEVAFREHSADMAKLDVLLEYGGVAVDFDVFFVRGERIKEVLQLKQSITCYGDEDGYNIGFVAGRKSAPLLTAWRRSYEDIYQNDWNFNQAKVCRYLSILYRDSNYVAGAVCNNPHSHGLHAFFKEIGKMNWTNSMAIHTYHRHSGVVMERPEDLYTGNFTNTTNAEMLQFLFEGKYLPPADPAFRDEMDPLTGLKMGETTTTALPTTQKTEATTAAIKHSDAASVVTTKVPVTQNNVTSVATATVSASVQTVMTSATTASVTGTVATTKLPAMQNASSMSTAMDSTPLKTEAVSATTQAVSATSVIATQMPVTHAVSSVTATTNTTSVTQTASSTTVSTVATTTNPVTAATTPSLPVTPGNASVTTATLKSSS
ncbi:uncharacterized protein LOC129593710 [Paramacrobiotus metropolitanus]|uniref:uncharacterized protein LOC129593710 n=1 Tax=Paramacrobiotus metropolitanus TaxID=2943436 RepID=UPI002445E34B|nr:uncharacterized protein LOC129593710 [Paramacrobiotus metropolitanus]